MVVVKTTKYFSKLAKKLLSDDAMNELFDYLEQYASMGDIIQGAGGVRKLRWKTGKDNKGKSGGVRVIYYYELDNMVILITLYSKKEKENLTQSEKGEIKKYLPQLIRQMKEE
jgi:hypothetical protein